MPLALCLACLASGRFEWVDGALTRAIASGGWVLLDNANLCNPTVLDRLNPLLEPGGEGGGGLYCLGWG
jgi:midasin